MAVQRLAVVAKCAGCGNIIGMACSIWAMPFAKQRMMGGCSNKTNRVKNTVEKKKVNALKASKRASKGK